MRMIATSLLMLLPAGCASLGSLREDSKAWQVNEGAAKDGTDPKLHVGMRVDDAMTFLEDNGFKRNRYSNLGPWRDNKPDGSSDERPSFHYEQVIPGSSLWSGSGEVNIWLYYHAGSLVDVRVRYHSTCL